MLLLFLNPYIKLTVNNPTLFNIVLTCEIVAGVFTIHRILKRLVVKKPSFGNPDRRYPNS
jgi:hypothetical protein